MRAAESAASNKRYLRRSPSIDNSAGIGAARRWGMAGDGIVAPDDDARGTRPDLVARAMSRQTRGQSAPTIKRTHAALTREGAASGERREDRWWRRE